MNNDEIISIEEAAHNYEYRHEDYIKTLDKTKKYYQHHKEVLEAQLATHFKGATGITICGTIAYITYYEYKENILEVIGIMEKIDLEWSVELDSEEMVIAINLFEYKE